MTGVSAKVHLLAQCVFATTSYALSLLLLCKIFEGLLHGTHHSILIVYQIYDRNGAKRNYLNNEGWYWPAEILF